MLTSTIALLLTFAPAELERIAVDEPAVSRRVITPADAPMPAPPMLDATGRSVRLLPDDQVARLAEIDQALKPRVRLHHVLGVTGGALLSIPVIAGVIAIGAVFAELTSFGTVLLAIVLSPLLVMYGTVIGLTLIFTSLPVALAVAAGASLVIGAIISGHFADAERRSLMTERQAILGTVVPPPALPVVTF